MSYLPLPDLFQLQRTNTQLLKIASNQKLFKSEYLRCWLGLSSNGESPVTDWKSLCNARLALKKEWQELPDSIFTEAELELLYDELIETLKSPPQVLPAFRRDIFSMSTLAQDFLANIDDQFNSDFELEMFSDDIRKYLNQYQEDFFLSCPVDYLVKVRWNLRKGKERLSIVSNETDSTETSHCFLVVFFKMIKKVVKAHCKALSFVIQESNDFIRVYADLWESYSNAGRKINSMFGPVLEVFNELYEIKFQDSSCPRVSMFKVMNRIWQQEVFEVNKEKLVMLAIMEIEDVVSGKQAYPESQRFVEGLLDLSLNELNVFFKYHSQVYIDGPYQYFHRSLVQRFAGKCNSKLESVLSLIALPVTIREIKDKSKIKSDAGDGDFGFNDMMDIEQEKLEDDEMIELATRNYGIMLEVSMNEMALFSQNKEEKIQDVILYLDKCKNVYF